jgi:FAD/FMN-containing dehydrogenase
VSVAHETPPERYDVALDLTGLDRLVEHEPGDLTLTVECGVTLASLRARLAEHGQEFPLEGARAERATVGGVLAANASGARRKQLGGARDRILGARFILGDGTLVRTGGKVVKNVAGYGIHRYLIGARGGLAILVDASFKLLPAPSARIAMIYIVDQEWIERAEWFAIARWEPAACTVVTPGLASGGGLPGALPPAFHLTLGFEDDAPRVEELRRHAIQRLGRPALELRDGEAQALWQQLADLEEVRPARLTFTSAHTTPDVSRVALPVVREFMLHAPCGRLHLFPETAPAAADLDSLDAAGFALIGGRGLGAGAARGPAVAISRLRERIRAALDPEGRFSLTGNPFATAV